MLSVYQKIDSSNLQDDCGICRTAMKNEDVVAHSGDNGHLHPMHRKCVRAWAERLNGDTCPYCATKIDTNSLFTWKEKCVTELKCIAQDALGGLAIGSFTLGIGVGAVFNHGLQERAIELTGNLKTSSLVAEGLLKAPLIAAVTFPVLAASVAAIAAPGLGLAFLADKIEVPNKGKKLAFSGAVAGGLVGVGLQAGVTLENAVTIGKTIAALVAVGGVVGGVAGAVMGLKKLSVEEVVVGAAKGAAVGAGVGAVVAGLAFIVSVGPVAMLGKQILDGSIGLAGAGGVLGGFGLGGVISGFIARRIS